MIGVVNRPLMSDIRMAYRVVPASAVHGRRGLSVLRHAVSLPAADGIVNPSHIMGLSLMAKTTTVGTISPDWSITDLRLLQSLLTNADRLHRFEIRHRQGVERDPPVRHPYAHFVPGRIDVGLPIRIENP